MKDLNLFELGKMLSALQDDDAFADFIASNSEMPSGFVKLATIFALTELLLEGNEGLTASQKETLRMQTKWLGEALDKIEKSEDTTLNALELVKPRASRRKPKSSNRYEGNSDREFYTTIQQFRTDGLSLEDAFAKVAGSKELPFGYSYDSVRGRYYRILEAESQREMEISQTNHIIKTSRESISKMLASLSGIFKEK